MLNVQTSVPQAVRIGSPEKRILPCDFFVVLAKVALQRLEAYQRLGGYQGLRKALDLGPEGTLRELSESKLLGRGGAAFPTAKKWEALFLQRASVAAGTWPHALRHLQCR